MSESGDKLGAILEMRRLVTTLARNQALLNAMLAMQVRAGADVRHAEATSWSRPPWATSLRQTATGLGATPAAGRGFARKRSTLESKMPRSRSEARGSRLLEASLARRGRRTKWSPLPARMLACQRGEVKVSKFKVTNRWRGKRAANRRTTQESLVGAPSCRRCREADAKRLEGVIYSMWCRPCYAAVCKTLGRKPK